jgi:7-carboxy-7-deazaguanine synthase
MSDAPAGRDPAVALLKVNEIFHSIQGESREAGRPCVFVRLTGCNLRCVWCDTPYAFEEGDLKSIDEIVAEIDRWKTRFVLVTGGEPLAQDSVHDLIARLNDRDHEVSIETGGSLDISTLDRRVTIVMDLKCPGSGMSDRNRLDNLEYLKSTDEVKFVVRDRADYEWAREVIRRHELPRRCGVLVSPVHGVLQPRSLARWVLEDRLGVRLQLQIHKYIWSAEARGV